MRPEPLDFQGQQVRADREMALDGLKEEINELVWRRLPGTTTLDEAEAVALKIYQAIAESWPLA